MNAEKKQEPDWAAIRGEFLNSSLTLREISEKYGVALGTVQKQSAKGKWSEKRKKLRADKAEKVSEKLHDRDVKQTVKDIERVCKAAGKLINQVNKAIAQVGKGVYVSHDRKSVTVSEVKNTDGSETIDQTTKREMKVKRYDTLIDTKKLSEISKTLLNIKAVLTGDDGTADDIESSGIIEICGQDLIDGHEDEQEGDLDAAAETGVNAAES